MTDKILPAGLYSGNNGRAEGETITAVRGI